MIPIYRLYFTGIVLLFCSAPGLRAQTFTWQNNTTAWSGATSWSPAGSVPNNNNAIARFGQAGTDFVNPTVDANFTISQLAFTANSFNYTFNPSAGVLTIDENANAATANAIVVSGGTHTFYNDFVFRNSAVSGSDDRINFNSLSPSGLNFYGKITIAVNAGLLVNGANGTVNVYGALTSVLGDGTSSNPGTLTITGSTVNFRAGMTYSAGGSLSVNSGRLNLEVGSGAAGIANSTNLILGRTATGDAAITLTGSGLTIRNTINIGANSANNVLGNVNRTIGVNAGTNGTGTFSGALDLAASTVANSVGTKTVILSAAPTNTATFSGRITATQAAALPLSLVVSGGGKVILSSQAAAGNAFAVPVTVEGNTTLLANTLAGTSATGSGAVSVGTFSTLGGSGMVAGNVTVAQSGVLLGGDGTGPTGMLTLSGSLTLNSGSIISMTLGPGNTHSSIARLGSGTWTFDPTQTFSFSNVQVGTFSGIITGLAVDPGVNSWTVANDGYTGVFTYLTGNVDVTISAVPEPSTTAAALLGVASLIVVQRRRAARQA